MKFPVIACILTLAACGSAGSHSASPAGVSLTSEPQSISDTPADNVNSNLPGTDAYGHYITTNWYPLDAPALRSDLYSCQSLGDDRTNAFKAYVEVFTDNSRLYHMAINAGGMLETFTAKEEAGVAAATPIVMTAGAVQSSNVLHGINEQTKTALGLSADSNWKINLRSSAMRGNIEMFISVEPSSSVSIPYGTCYRVGQ